jgi:hypothetical protein
MSWAMGVRKPGFLMLSMWNPIGPDGHPLHSNPSDHGSSSQSGVTTENHLCLLPDQLGIFISYGVLLAITFISLITRAILTPILNLTPFSSAPIPSTSDDLGLLPTTIQDLKRRDDDQNDAARYSDSSTSSTSSNNASAPNPNLAPRTNAARTRSVSPAKGYGLPASQVRYATPPLINSAGSNVNSDRNGDRWKDDNFGKPKIGVSAYDSVKSRKKSVMEIVLREAWTSIFRVAWIVTLVYVWLIYYG